MTAPRDGPHAVEQLFEELATFGSYPARVVPVPARIPGFSFFPGGLGLWNAVADGAPPEFPRGGVMILGHNFYSFDGFQDQLRTGRTDDQYPTGRVLLALLDETGIDKNACFFTNFFLGLSEGSKNTGTFPGARDKEFVERCRRFLCFELKLQEPRLVLVLGAEVPRFLAPLGAALEPWRGCTLTEIDARDLALVESVDVEGVRFTAACLTHPSHRRLNVYRRSFRGLKGEEAERELLRVAWSRCSR
jgi:uracil-DNA glycosylase